jgi:hypothetical protein
LGFRWSLFFGAGAEDRLQVELQRTHPGQAAADF